MSVTELRVIDSFTGEYRFLSNFYPSLIRHERILYPTVEHAYQASKTSVMSEKRLIAAAASPCDAKRMGQKVLLPRTWESIKVGIMRSLVLAKFMKHLNLRELLLATGDVPLIEGNTWGDRFWGVCGGEGKNQLGQILRDVRDDLKQIPTD